MVTRCARIRRRALRVLGNVIGIASVPYTLWRLSRSGYVPRGWGRL